MSFESDNNAEKIERDIKTGLLILKEERYRVEFMANPELQKQFEELQYQAGKPGQFPNRDELSHQIAKLMEKVSHSDSDEPSGK